MNQLKLTSQAVQLHKCSQQLFEPLSCGRNQLRAFTSVMPPRLSHTKSRTGCQACKRRRIKVGLGRLVDVGIRRSNARVPQCDEGKPKCNACSRHELQCEYKLPGNAVDSKLEARLVHHWTSCTSSSFSPAVDYWRSQVPSVALEHRYVFDALLAIAALDICRKAPAKIIVLDGQQVQIRNPIYDPSHPEVESTRSWRGLPDSWKLQGNSDEAWSSEYRTSFGAEEHHGMLQTSRQYFDRAIEGHQKAVATLTVEQIEAVFITSVLISIYGLFILSKDEDDVILPTFDPVHWLHLGEGTHVLAGKWFDMVGETWRISSGVHYGEPDMTDDVELFRYENCQPFEKLLTWAADFEQLSSDDIDTYQRTLSYIGLIYKGIKEKTDKPLSTSRRFTSMPSCCPSFFVSLVEAKRPRALAILSYFFAMMKLVEHEVQWVQGIAERQVPMIFQQLPSAWRELLVWPMAIVGGDTEQEPMLDLC